MLHFQTFKCFPFTYQFIKYTKKKIIINNNNIPKLKISAFGVIRDKSENLISGAQYAGVIP